MRKKGQTGMGEILMVFIAVIVGVIILTASAQLIGDATNTIDVANDSMAAAATNGTTLALIVQLSGKSVGTSMVVYNATGDYIILSGNYTIYNNQVIDGVETAGINISADEAGGIDDGAWQLSYTYEPTTYISNSGGRAVAGIIIIFFALAIAVVTLFPTLRSKVLDLKP